MAITYAELLERQHQSRPAFGRMLLNWRRRNGWTQYTACSWAEEAGFEMISYGNLSVIEQGKAGELRQKAFWQLGELNRRIADKDWGPVKTQAIKEKLENAIPLGDNDCPIWISTGVVGFQWRSRPPAGGSPWGISNEQPHRVPRLFPCRGSSAWRCP